MKSLIIQQKDHLNTVTVKVKINNLIATIKKERTLLTEIQTETEVSFNKEPVVAKNK